MRETSWRGIVDGIIGGYLDGAQMPAAMPTWLTAGGYQNQPVPVVSGLTMTRNGNAISLSKKLYDKGVYTAADFKRVLLESSTETHTLGIVHPSSIHNLLLRYWLAANNINPDKDVHLTTIPPAQMVADLKAGSIDGYCISEPWNIRAAMEGIGFSIATDLEIWDGHPGKVFGVREDWAIAYPNTHVALVKALLEACAYCADPKHAREICELLAGRKYLSTNLDYIRLGDPEDKTCTIGNPVEYSHQIFFGDRLNRPSRTEHLWMMTQMARWGDIPFPRNWVEILERVCRVSVFSTAARELGYEVNYQREPITLFDGQTFNADDPIAYLNQVMIHNNFTIAEVHLSTPKQLVTI